MQDIHAIGGGAGGGGRFFGGGDRRLRPHNQPNNQALKCPRCDSLNTKFCYYNNYNLSQPRHFCKSCRRYWTKGGVLRNIPVGGGCRKAKRLKPKSSVGAASSGDAPSEQSSNAQSSSSESSSLTAATPISATTAVAEGGSAQGNTTSTSAAVYPFPDARFFNGNHDFDHQPMANQSRSDVEAFTLEIGSFASLMGSSVDTMGFGMADIPSTSYGRVEQGNQAPLSDNSGKGVRGIGISEEFEMQEMTAGLSTDKMPATEALDWGSSGDGGKGEDDQGMFDLTAAVDPAYWGQPQWTDNDGSLNYLP